MLPPSSARRRTTAARKSLVRDLLLVIVVVVIAATAGSGLSLAQSLPGGWADQDIGAVGLGGSGSSSSGTFTLQGAGADIWGTADSFNFANQALVGDGQIVAHVKSMQNTNTYAKAGLMIRETLTASSAHVVLDLKPNGGVEFMTRATAGGSTSFIAGGTGSYLKLVRSNGVFTAYVSNDGITWTAIGSKAIPLGASTWVGLVVCSHNTGVLNTAVFDNVSIAAAADAPPTVAITSPASGASFSAGANVSIGANANDGDATPVARVDFYANSGTANTLVGSDTSSPYAITWSNVAAGSYSLTAVATDTANRSTTSAPVSISVAATGGGGTLPAGWADQDIGAAGLAGSASFSSGAFTVKGAGADIWGTADSFNFANQLLAGDGQIIVHVASMTNTNAYAKAGVMIRETLTASSPSVVLDVKPGGGVEFMTRATSGGSTSFIAGGTASWLKLARSNGVFTASISPNGSSWTVIGSKTMAMAANAWIGLAVCSHNTGALNTSVFDNVSINRSGGSPTMTITSPPSGTTFPPGTNVVFTVKGADPGAGCPNLYVTDSSGTVQSPIYDLWGGGTPTCTILWFSAPAGTYSVIASYGQATSDVIRVNVSTTPGSDIPPIVSALDAVWSGADLVLTAHAGDPDTTPIARVDFYYVDFDGVVLLGTATTAPYTVTWPSAVLPGTNSLVAVATDTAGIATALWK